MINTKINHYRIIRLIGEGGMASVYEAVHEILGTKVAIKVLNPILSANWQIKDRFIREGQLIAFLNHSNIIKVSDLDEQPQQVSIIMEYLEGEDLNQMIKRKGPLSENEILNIFSQTLSAFQYAHSQGIVHRDIKPSNIFILPDGQVKILDFGIAKLFGLGNETTQSGAQVGTPMYMSPEQVKSDKSIDYRSDIYSLGATLFFAVNGITPYDPRNDSQFDIFTKIVYESFPESIIKSRFDSIINKACQKNREERYQNCEQMLNEMEQKTASASIPSVINDIGASNKSKYEKLINPKETNLSETPKEKSRILLFSFVSLFVLLAFLLFYNLKSNKVSPSETAKSTSDSLENNHNPDEVSNQNDFSPKNESRFYKINKSVINDTETGNYWLIAPDKSFTYEQALYFSESQSSETERWQIPSFSDIKKLYDPQSKAGTGFYLKGRYYPARINHTFDDIGSGSWFWISDAHPDPNKAYAINLYEGIKVEVDLYDTTIPVHVLLLRR
jgi:serine/threonine protein kinase